MYVDEYNITIYIYKYIYVYTRNCISSSLYGCDGCVCLCVCVCVCVKDTC